MAEHTQSAPDTPRQGLVVSGAMHIALLAVLALGFTQAPPFSDATESIPVETISASQLNEIMQGEKDAKPAPAPVKAAPPAKPAPEAPPPPPRPEPPKPVEPPPPEPPRRPEPPPKPEPPTPEPPRRPEPPKPQAEDAPSPPQRPRPEKAEETPRPPDRPRPEKAEETPRPPDRPRPVKTEEPPKPAFKPDEIAKALSRDKAEAKPDARPEAKPKTAFDPSAISKLIGQTKTAELSPKAPAQGLPNRQAARMSVSLENGLNEWFRDSYKNCWTLPPSNPTGETYVFDVRVTFNPDGSLSGRPVMLNPPRDPEWRAHAESVLRAVMRCNPLRIPGQYAPYFDQWRSKTIHFDPSSAEG